MRSHFAAGLKPALGFLAACALAACTGGSSSLFTDNALAITQGFTVGGTVSGLIGSGLALQNNSGDTLVVSTNGSFTFHTLLFSGNTYNVTVSAQPGTPAQTCVVGQGIGTVAGANVASVTVMCANKTAPLDAIGGTVQGVSGSGLVLQNDGADDLAVSNGAFTFPTALASGMPYNVTVRSPPLNPYEDCTVANGSGTTGGSDVNNVSVSCITNSNPAHTIGGTISGLSAAKGTIVIQDNGRDNLTISADGPFTFAIPIPSGSFYNVTSQSLQGPQSFTCAFTNGSGQVGSGNVTDVSIMCVTSSPVVLTPISINVAGLAGSGLVMQDNGADNLSVAANGISTFPTALVTGSGYSVSVLTQPLNPSQLCVDGDGEGSGTVVAGTPVVVHVFCTTISFAIGGTVTGSGGARFTLQDIGGDTLVVPGDGPFLFPTRVLSGAAYNVTVATQPPGLTCVVSNGSGTVAAADVSNVTVTCTSAGVNEWTWIGGNSTTVTAGVYGTLGVPAIGNIPGTRAYGVTFVDKNGLLWLFGGTGYGNTTTGGSSYLNDLWQYDPSANLWAWMGGPQTEGGSGVYGTLGVPAAANIPGSRYSSAHWTDAAGNFWLFGGNGLDSTGTGNTLSDLWMYNTTTGLWTWINGPKIANSVGVYGAQGQAAAANVPGSRELISSWTDAAGNFWIFGGYGYATVALANDYLNDLWMYSPTTGQWTWVTGFNGLQGSAQYGTLGVAAPGNTPGARTSAVTWTDGAGNLWLFGGDGFSPASGQPIYFNDLWKFSPGTGLWTWVGGANVPNQPGVYGTQGAAAAGNIPGARTESVSFVDRHGNFWLFGGLGLSSSATCCGSLNDMWEFNPTTGLWTWMNGSNVVNIFGTYGTQGVPGPTTTPGSRRQAFSWTDSGDFFMQGGLGNGAATNGLLNDLWEYNTGP